MDHFRPQIKMLRNCDVKRPEFWPKKTVFSSIGNQINQHTSIERMRSTIREIQWTPSTIASAALIGAALLPILTCAIFVITGICLALVGFLCIQGMRNHQEITINYNIISLTNRHNNKFKSIITMNALINSQFVISVNKEFIWINSQF